MVYKVYCRECGWTITDPVMLKGEANWLAGRHISDTGHSVAIRQAETAREEEEDIEFYRHERNRSPVEILRPLDQSSSEPLSPPSPDAPVRRCGPVFCEIETV